MLLDISFSTQLEITDEFHCSHNNPREIARPARAVVDADRRRRWRRERKQKRGCRSGLLARLRKDPHRPALPNKFIFLSNTQSLVNKMDELELLVTGGRYVQNCCVMVITKSWFHPLIPSEAIQLPSHTVHGSDRNKEESGKSRGGGLCVYVHGDWCRYSIAVYKKKIGSSDLETISVKCCPFFLPRELTVALIMAVYIPTDANISSALSLLPDTIHKLQRSPL